MLNLLSGKELSDFPVIIIIQNNSQKTNQKRSERGSKHASRTAWGRRKKENHQIIIIVSINFIVSVKTQT